MMNQNIEKEHISLLILIKRLIKHFKTNFLIYVLFSSVSTTGGGVYYHFTPKVFSSSLIAYSNNLSSEIINEVFDDLNRLIKTKYPDKAAEILGIEVWDMNLIRGFRVSLTNEILKDFSPEQKNKALIFKLEVEVTDPKVLGLLEERIPIFIEEEPFIQRKMRAFRASFESNIVSIDREIEYLESLKEYNQSLLSRGSVSGGSLMFDISALSSTIVELKEKKEFALNQLSDNRNDVNIIKGFTKFYKPDRPRLSKALASGFVIGLVLAALYSCRREINSLFIED